MRNARKGLPWGVPNERDEPYAFPAVLEADASGPARRCQARFVGIKKRKPWQLRR